MNIEGSDLAVDANAFGAVQDALRQQEAIGGNDQDVRFKRLQTAHHSDRVFLSFFETERFRGRHGDAVLLGQHLDRRWLELHAPTTGAVRLSQRQNDVMTILDKPLKRSGGEIRGTGKNNSHGCAKQKVMGGVCSFPNCRGGIW